jgi:hypothetical protein
MINDTDTFYYTQRVQPLKRVYDRLKAICTSHIAVAECVVGDNASLAIDNNSYPLVHLETIGLIREDEHALAETCTIAYNVLDLLTPNHTQDDLIQGYDKCKQIGDEIKQYIGLNKLFGAHNISSADYLLSVDGEAITVRVEFTLDIEKQLVEDADLKVIFGE